MVLNIFFVVHWVNHSIVELLELASWTTVCASCRHIVIASPGWLLASCVSEIWPRPPRRPRKNAAQVSAQCLVFVSEWSEVAEEARWTALLNVFSHMVIGFQTGISVCSSHTFSLCHSLLWGCYSLYGGVRGAGTLCRCLGLSVVPDCTVKWQEVLQFVIKAWAMLAPFVIASFLFATPRNTCRSWCCLYVHMHSECSSRPRCLVLLQDLTAGEPGSLFNLQEALQVMQS